MRYVISFVGTREITSHGALSDEFLRLFLCIKQMQQSDMQALEGKLTGLRDRGENITLKLVPLKEAWKEAPDAKLLSSLALYHYLSESNKLNVKK